MCYALLIYRDEDTEAGDGGRGCYQEQFTAIRDRLRAGGALADSQLPARVSGRPPVPTVVLDDPGLQVRAVAVTHGRAVPAFAYRFDTVDGSVVFSGDTTVTDDLIALAQGADILVHHVAERVGAGELILSHYLPAEPGGGGVQRPHRRGPGRATPDAAR